MEGKITLIKIYPHNIYDVGVDRRRGSGVVGSRKSAYWMLGRVPDIVSEPKQSFL